jgi:hypothetical protein
VALLLSVGIGNGMPDVTLPMSVSEVSASVAVELKADVSVAVSVS